MLSRSIPSYTGIYKATGSSCNTITKSENFDDEESPGNRAGYDIIGILSSTVPTTGLILLFPTLYFSTLEGAMLLSATLTAAISVIALTARYWEYRYSIFLTYFLFLILTYIMVNTNKIITFFLSYECFLLPSAILVWCFSPNKRGLKTTLLFLMWTQLGSVLVLLGTINIFTLEDAFEFITGYIKKPLSPIYQTMILFGFLIKIPVFPFYFWLTKTHVESVTSFSIFLSGFLVKIAVFGLYKYIVFLTKGLLLVAVALSMSSAITTSLLFLHQVDLKKKIAYATIQEMSQVVMSLLLLCPINLEVVSLFLTTHTLLSSKYFYLNDVVYKLYNTRSILVLSGIGNLSPKLTTILATTLVLFRGLPFTAKNSVEFTYFGYLTDVDLAFALLWVVMVALVGNVFFSYTFLKMAAMSHSRSLEPKDIDMVSMTVIALLCYIIVNLQQIMM